MTYVILYGHDVSPQSYPQDQEDISILVDFARYFSWNFLVLSLPFPRSSLERNQHFFLSFPWPFVLGIFTHTCPWMISWQELPPFCISFAHHGQAPKDLKGLMAGMCLPWPPQTSTPTALLKCSPVPLPRQGKDDICKNSRSRKCRFWEVDFINWKRKVSQTLSD